MIISTILKDLPPLLISIFPRLFHLFEFILIDGLDLVSDVRGFADESLLLLSEI